MSGSATSTNGSTNSDEMAADLSQNQDEALDLELALGALGGLRHSAACDAAERSTRRFDERQHRFHESRMKAMGMEGEEKPVDDMSHQVLIRSPIVHNHYQGNGPAATPPPAQTPPTTQQPAAPVAAVDFPAWAKAAILASVLGSGAGAGIGLYSLFADRSQNVTNITEGKDTGIGLVEPGKPVKQE